MPARRDNAALRYAAKMRAADRRKASRLIQKLGTPLVPREKIKVSIPRAAQQVNFILSRAEDIWRKEARRIEAWEMDALRGAVRARTRRPLK